MKKILSVIMAVAMIFTCCMISFGYSECDGYSTEVPDEEYYKKFYGQGVEINVCNWGEFIANDSVNFIDVNEDFEELTGIKVNYSLFSTNEELYAKLRAGGTSYDIIVPSDYMIGRMINENMLSEINFDNIPNFEYIDETYKHKSFDADNKYSVPFFWGVVGIIYNTTMVDEEDLTGWDILWNEKYAGNILMFGNSRDAFAISLLNLGYSYNTTDEKELSEAAAHLNAQKPMVQAWVMDEIYDKMEAGEAAVAPYYNGDAVLMMDDNEDLDFYLPENTSFFVDSMVIPSNAKNKEAAEMYINYMCEPTVAAANSYYVGYSTPISAAYDLLDEDLQESEVAYPDEELVSSLDALLTLPEETSTIIDEYWTEIMADSSSVLGYAIFITIVFVLVTWMSLHSKYKKYRRNKY